MSVDAEATVTTQPPVRAERVAVVVVMYNSGPLLADFVASLPAGLAGVDHELVAVDNDSTDGSAGRCIAASAPRCSGWRASPCPRGRRSR